jgi:hypothetical protein
LRWHGRLELEARLLTIPDALFALWTVARLPADGEAIGALRKLLKRAARV